MTDGGGRPSRRFDAAVVRRLLDGLSSHLRSAGSYNHNLMIVGGAALALLWEDRLTRDVDVPCPNLRPPTAARGRPSVASGGLSRHTAPPEARLPKTVATGPQRRPGAPGAALKTPPTPQPVDAPEIAAAALPQHAFFSGVR